jgi:heterotetrameric sarcosine oxidase delta subunit
MSFTIACPHCGPRPATEFAFLGEVTTRPPGSTLDKLSEALYFNDNIAGVQSEWWFHRYGCERWLIARRDTRTNEVHEARPAAATEEPAR